MKGRAQCTVTVWGTGKPFREFMYSGDMADATVFIMERVSFKDLIPAGSKEIRNTHINIGTGEEITIADLAVLLKETTGFRGNLEFDHQNQMAHRGSSWTLRSCIRWGSGMPLR